MRDALDRVDDDERDRAGRGGAEEREHDGPPPLGRIYFFALAASAGNVLFLGAIVLDGLGAGWWSSCGQA